MTTARSEGTDGDEGNKLEDHIQALPQELQDKILDFTLIAAVEGVQAVIDDTPPWQISVNSRTRKFVAPKFYETASFVVPERVVIAREAPNLHLLTQWLRKVPTLYRSEIQEIRIRGEVPARPSTIEEEVQLYSDHMIAIRDTHFIIGRRGYDFGPDVMKLPCYSSDKDLTVLTWLSYDEIGWVIKQLLSNMEDDSESELDSGEGH
ncbi:hypothetical protein CB0940_06876 [Cercospora beticola]|uniref:Uncharacterized protein n=1 Tax=Cercospora beticola TaxID=122368 RepID=A0A2G5H9M6_CERBT|nr:hypothetical protein CB0940_06876 [Cercospora beticola]PIA89234.1 hypothetical protein CB0940_06876 [Cercospora beticola]WPB02794.1 hypothetical protein RHO25_007430 [Cercospora beticola]